MRLETPAECRQHAKDAIIEQWFRNAVESNLQAIFNAFMLDTEVMSQWEESGRYRQRGAAGAGGRVLNRRSKVE